MSQKPRSAIPRATYRLQLQAAFGFDDAARLAAYLAHLGISHVYASPYLMARPGSTHGYDIVDHDRLNPELGGDVAFGRMSAALKQHDLGQIMDFVPNHMGVGGADNPFWLDVLEWGPDADHAGWFDIDWDPDSRYLHDKLLVPFLGDQYGAELERGKLRLKFDLETGSFAVWAYDTHKLPVSPLHYDRILGTRDPDLERLGDAFSGLPGWRPQIGRHADELKAEMAAVVRDKPEARAAIETALARFNGQPGDLESWQRLHALIQDQHWRIAHFRVAADDINYRRFFNINDLAGLRMELPDVFERVHRLAFRLMADGVVDGLRIDHVDGLLDPAGYLRRLREKAPHQDFYLVVEKILARHETLRDEWPVQGTTGYDFANEVTGLLIDPAGEAGVNAAYAAFVGGDASFAGMVRESKLRIMENEMASELNVLARDAARLARQNPRTADFTRNILRRALKQVIASFPVYRTYLDFDGNPTDADRRDLDWAVAQARQNDADLDASALDFVHAVLSGDLVAQPASGFSRHSALRAAMKAQQYSGPVMAKGLEDTAFYRYNRFIALNEVGGHPDEFGLTLGAFHHANRYRAEHWPHAILGTSTHDTKRGEDTRARLAVLSEMPDEWLRQVQAWSRLLRARRGDVEGTAPPDRNDEYLFYQLLVGTWPVELLTDAPDVQALASYADRLKATMIKSMREAKVQSTWAAPNQAAEDAMTSFVADALDPSGSTAFFDSILPFAQTVARLGVHNSLVQTVLKLTSPGVPDLYQGSELWDLSMVDPDNRRPVDYALRERLLEDVLEALAKDRNVAMRQFMHHWQDGSVKLAAVATLLRYRQANQPLFAAGSYEPLTAEGPKAGQICAFLRQHEDDALITAVVRFPTRLEANGYAAESTVPIPEPFHAAGWTDIVSGTKHTPGDALKATELFAVAPVAVLVPDIKTAAP
jgi:(1->4)-alpha-D-glucan 1-alpha-D-glucosylmutase